MWSFFGSKRVTDKRLENALKSRAGIIQEIISAVAVSHAAVYAKKPPHACMAEAFL